MINFKKVILAAIPIILGVWLYIANSVVVYFMVDSSRRLSVTSFDKYENMSAQAYSKITSEIELKDFTEQYSISGGAFCETSIQNTNRIIKLLLKSRKKHLKFLQ